jgi:PAS domain S-box-containing protein
MTKALPINNPILGALGQNLSLQEGSLFFLSMLNSVADPIFVKDAQHRYVIVNDAFCKLVGRTREELSGKSDFDFFPEEQAKVFREKDNLVFQSGLMSENEEPVTNAEGVTHWVSTKKNVFTNHSGERLLVGVIHDVTDQHILRKRYEDDARQERLRHVSADFDESADFDSVCQRLVAEISDLGYLAAGQAYRVRPGLEGTWSLRPIGTPYIRAKVLGQMGFAPSPMSDGPIEAPQYNVEFASLLARENGVLRMALGLGYPLLLDTITRGQDARADAAYKAGYEGVIVVPLVIAGENVAILEFFTAKGRDVDARLVQSVEEICQRAGLVLQRNATINRMRESEALKGAIISSSMDGLIVIDANGRVVEFNPGAERIFGFKREQLIGSDITLSIIPAQHVDAHLNAMNRFFLGRPMSELRRRVEIEGMRQDGQLIPVELSITHIEASGRRLFAAYVRDLTEKKAAEAIIAQQQAKIVASSKMSELGTMAGGIAHEINNPLAVIHGKSQKLQSLFNVGEIDPAVFRKDLKMIEDTATRIAKIVKGLRAFARDGAKDPSEIVLATSVIDDTLELCAARFRHHGISLRYQGGSPAMVECRPVQISQVLLNLLNNSFDSVQSLSAPWIEISVTEESDTIRLAVTDSGPGIPPELRERVMQPFYTTKPVGKGTGLGLSISRAIVEDHGGKLTIDDVGSHMRISMFLPRRMALGLEKKSA